MRRVKVSILMCENETGGFVTGIAKYGDYSENEFNEKKYNELIKDIQIMDGCFLSYSFEWYNAL